MTNPVDDETADKIIAFVNSKGYTGGDSELRQMISAWRSQGVGEGFDTADYKRLKALELKGIQDYRELREAPVLTTERVLAFINQLSPWNLKTTGKSVLEAYVEQQRKEEL